MIKSFHSSRYIFNRLRYLAYTTLKPNHPWLTAEANRFLAGFLDSDHVGLEFGAGRSTIWFARRMRQLTSVESSNEWYEKVQRKLTDHDLGNVQLHFASTCEEFIEVAESFNDASLDFVLVDGGPRSWCANATTHKLRPGGVIVVDDCHRVLPSVSKSPNARTPELGPRLEGKWESTPGRTWGEFLHKVDGWEHLWTSNGVKDTGLWIRPSQTKV